MPSLMNPATGSTAATPNYGTSYYGQYSGDASADNQQITSLGEHTGGANAIANQYSQNAANAQSVDSPSVSNSYVTGDLANTQQSLDLQQQGLQGLYNQANGLGGPTAAQRDVMAGGQRSISNQYALANGLGGSAGALARRNAAMQANAINTTSANTANAIAAQQQAAAQAGYTSALQGYQQQGQAAQYGAQQLAQAQGQINQNQTNINDQNTLGWQQLGQSAEQAQLQADSSLHNATASSLAAQAAAHQQANANLKNSLISGTMGMVGAGMMGLASDERIKNSIQPLGRHSVSEGTKSGQKSNASGTMRAGDIDGYLSDERVKTHLSSSDNEADRFLETMSPYSYRYDRTQDEPTSHPSGGRYLGVMAQNVEKGPTGNTLVSDTPRGKMLEGHALMSAMAAGEGRLHDRLKDVEARLASMKGGR